jgi:hypothetical protein
MGLRYNVKPAAIIALACLFSFTSISLASPAAAVAQQAVAVNQCQACHDGHTFRVQFAQSAHGKDRKSVV